MTTNELPIVAVPVRRKLLGFIPIGELHFRLSRPLRVLIAGYPRLDYLSIPKDFLSDGASVPWLFWRLVPKCGSYLRGAIVHDYLYRTGHYDKAKSDQILWELAEEDGTPFWQCFVIWFGLLLGGGPAWRKYERMRAKGIDPTMKGDLD